MRTSDIRVLATLNFCCMATAALGCSGSSLRTHADAAVDSTADSQAADTPTVVSAADTRTADPVAADAVADVLGPDLGVDSTPHTDALATTNALITFRLENASTDTLYLRRDCTTPIKVTSLADGTTYGNSAACACDCASASCNGTLACGACPPDSGIPIAPGASTDISWLAQWTTTQTKTGPYGPFQCLQRGPIPTGPYRFAIAVYAASADATAARNPRTVEMTFTLGTADATIEVPLS